MRAFPIVAGATMSRAAACPSLGSLGGALLAQPEGRQAKVLFRGVGHLDYGPLLLIVVPLMSEMPGESCHFGAGELSDALGLLEFWRKKMSRYFFDLHNGDGPLSDDQGTECASLELVRNEAAKILLDVARDEMVAADTAVISITVRDADGLAILVSSITLSNEWLGTS